MTGMMPAMRPLTLLAALAAGAVACGAPAAAQSPAAPPSSTAAPTMTPDNTVNTTAPTLRASGSFDVKLEPQPSTDAPGEATPGRMTITKTFHGDLQATGKGQMLALMTEVKGSAGYVAMERVTGTLNGRSGSFALQHTGTMNRGAPQLSIVIVPDSGTGDLVGLAGAMHIDIQGGKHFYTFDYTLPPPATK